ncbi:protein tyrosine phosphatase [Bifidobacterium sp. 82T25]|nr:protein tyrosine phosphatase [Bifidobacterium miconisargentati]MBW3090936.1 protein tyrosine phosphatase [Bifidobacterium miconisargentati]
MQLLFVCTGNQCRSVMAEYYCRFRLAQFGVDPENTADAITVSSAGTLQYPPHAADPLAIDMLASDGLDAAAHRSTPISTEISRAADLILCFERAQISELLGQNPAAVRKTFLFDDFVNACAYLGNQGPIPGDSLEAKLREVMDSMSMIRPFLPAANETVDPHRQSREVFEQVYAEIKHGIDTIFHTIGE